MSKRTLFYLATRPSVLLPALFGVAMLEASPFWSICCFGFAAVRASRLYGHSDIDRRLRLRDSKRRHHIARLLTDQEREEVLAIDHYRERLLERGAEPKLAERVLDEAWEIVRRGGDEDVSGGLRLFRQQLPEMQQPSGPPESGLLADLQDELVLLQATRKEVESLG